MTLNLQYVTGKNGQPKAVQIPIRQWENLMKDYKHSKQVSKLRNDLSAAISEIKETRKGNKKTVLLKEFLNEL